MWQVGLLPPFPVCIAGASLTGLLLMGLGGRTARPAPLRPLPSAGLTIRRLIPVRNAAQTAALMAWITARTDNPLFTYEMRTRTRSGRWADWRYFVPIGLLAGILLAVTYPDIVIGLSLLSPFRFFDSSLFSTGRPDPLTGFCALAALLLVAQCYAIGFRGQAVGENLIARDRQRGIWGFILLTPLTMRQIFRGKLFGQTAGFIAVWVALGLCSLLLYALAAPAVGVGPAFFAWLTGQVFVAALFLLGVGLGAALATFPIFPKTLRGASTLLFVGLVGGGIYWNTQVFDLGQPVSWPLTAGRLLLGSAYALALAAPLFAFAEWRIGVVRRKDISFGDGVE